jgi:hypothetical protein
MTIAKGEKMYAADILNLTFFPRGTILTFSSTAWGAMSTEFKSIWKPCNAANHAADAFVPDLTNKFLRGADRSGAEGGADSRSVTLAPDNLPSHSHGKGTLALGGLDVSNLSIGTSNSEHEHTLSGKTTETGNHKHDAHAGEFSPGAWHDSMPAPTGVFSSYKDFSKETCEAANGTRIKMNAQHNETGKHDHSFSSDSKAVKGGAHSHNIMGNITGGTISGLTDSVGFGTALIIDTLPSYYEVIYIIKVV